MNKLVGSAISVTALLSVGNYEAQAQYQQPHEITIEVAGAIGDTALASGVVYVDSGATRQKSTAEEEYKAYCTANGVRPSFTADCNNDGYTDYKEMVDLIADIKNVSTNAYAIACNKKGIMPSIKSDCNKDGVPDFEANAIDRVLIKKLMNSRFYLNCLFAAHAPYYMADCILDKNFKTDGRADILQAVHKQTVILNVIENTPPEPMPFIVPDIKYTPPALNTAPPVVVSKKDQAPKANTVPSAALTQQLNFFNQSVADTLGRVGTYFNGTSSTPRYMTSSLTDSDRDGEADLYDPEPRNSNVTRSNDRYYTLDND